MAGRLRVLKLLGLLSITASCFTPFAQRLAATPTKVSMSAGEALTVPVTGVRPERMVSSNQQVATAESDLNSAVKVTASSAGTTDIQGKLFGLIPWKTHVQVLPVHRVYVGGQAVGIHLQSKGPVVVGFRRLADGNSPGAKARVQVGDMIVSVNKKPVHTSSDLQAALLGLKDPVHLVVQRGENKKQLDVMCPTNLGKHQLGLYVRDRTVGVGTLTFYDSDHNSFGALGHIITDADTGQPVVGTGNLYNALITGLKPGEIGAPGEKKGTFSERTRALGTIERNTSYGVFGHMPKNTKPFNSPISEPIPVARPDEVHEGLARMYTVIHGQKIEGFDVRVMDVARQSGPATKSMIIKVVDPKLLEQTGGIIQGMSGSPLVQDGHLIGAVTHVFVSDPTRGYAVFAQWMLSQTSRHTDARETWDQFIHHYAV